MDKGKPLYHMFIHVPILVISIVYFVTQQISLTTTAKLISQAHRLRTTDSAIPDRTKEKHK